MWVYCVVFGILVRYGIRRCNGRYYLGKYGCHGSGYFNGTCLSDK